MKPAKDTAKAVDCALSNYESALEARHRAEMEYEGARRGVDDAVRLVNERKGALIAAMTEHDEAMIARGAEEERRRLGVTGDSAK